MRLFIRSSGLALILALAAWQPASAADPKPLTEADVLKLVELQIDDQAIVARIRKTGVGFKPDEAVLKRLKDAGASEEVLAAIQGKKPESPKLNMMLWVRRSYDYIENPLVSEVSLNGKSLGTFKSESRKALGDALVKGWNEITVKTVPQLPTNDTNCLLFAIGSVAKDAQDKLIMKPVLWEFRNAEGWHLKDGKFSHDLGPDVKEVTLTFRVYFAGCELEGQTVKNGDYVLKGSPSYDYHNIATTGTLFVNGTPLDTFMVEPRQLVITSLLKQGKNEIKLVSTRAKNCLVDNNTTFSVSGPAEYSVAQKKFLLGPIVEFKSMEGWTRDKKTGLLTTQGDAAKDAIERIITFTLDKAPN